LPALIQQFNLQVQQEFGVPRQWQFALRLQF